jgi:hypothetical protein
MFRKRQYSLALLGVLCVLDLLTGCTPQGPEGASQPSPSALHPPAYLDKIDSEGLIAGKTPMQLMGDLTFNCMQDAGWTNLVQDADGSFSGHVPPEQSDKYASDQAECQATVEKAYPTVQMSDRAIRERYALEVETRQCLIEHGFVISEPPSEQTWVEQFVNGGTGLWLPYWEVFNQSTTTAKDEAALKLDCPDPGDRFYRQ